MSGQRSDAWLLRGDTVLASAEVARTRAERRRGLRGRARLDGVLVLDVRWVHTFGVRFAIDVAYLDGDHRVVRVSTVVPNHLGRPCWSARRVVEAPQGAMQRWGVAVGDQLVLR